MPPERLQASSGSCRNKLARGYRRWLHGSVIALFASGVAWLLLHYFCQVAGPYGLEAHPLEPWSLRLHGAFAAVALLLLGSLLPIHIIPGLRGGRHLGSGLSMLGVWSVLAVTGYLLYYASGDSLRQAVSLAHWIIGLALPLILWIHLRHRSARRARER
jgi:hypothetical protein